MFLCGYNMPGYLPDEQGIFTVDTFDEAKRGLIDEILFAADYTDEASAEQLTELAEDVNLWSGPDCSGEVDGFVYWIAVAEQ